jgi:hypothetical protein
VLGANRHAAGGRRPTSPRIHLFVRRGLNYFKLALLDLLHGPSHCFAQAAASSPSSDCGSPNSFIRAEANVMDLNFGSVLSERTRSGIKQAPVCAAVRFRLLRKCRYVASARIARSGPIFARSLCAVFNAEFGRRFGKYEGATFGRAKGPHATRKLTWSNARPDAD